MDLLGTKILVMFILGTVSLIFGFVPLKIGKVLGIHNKSVDATTYGRKHLCTSLLLCFGGGVLLATSVVHILPEVRNGLVSQKNASEFPDSLAELVLASGFFLIYFMEELFVLLMPESEVSEDDSRMDKAHLGGFTSTKRKQEEKNETAAAGETKNNNKMNAVDEVDTGSIDAGTEHVNLSEIEVDPSHEQEESEGPDNLDTSITSYNPKYAGHLHTSTQSMFPNYRANVEASKVSRSTHRMDFSLPKIKLPNTSKILGTRSRNTESGPSSSEPFYGIRVRDFMAVLALSFHSVFEGLVIGLGQDIASVWQVFAAVALHKFIVAFVLGVELCAAQLHRLLYTLYIVVFSITSPIGVAIGIGISQAVSTIDGASVGSPSDYLVIWVLNGIAAGTILYVVMFEVLQREKARAHIQGILQFGAVLTGFVVMVLIHTLGSETGYIHSHKQSCHTPTGLNVQNQELPPPHLDTT